VVVLLAMFSALLTACGLGLFGLGLWMGVQAELAGGFLSCAVGLLTLYGAYLFGRASYPTRSVARDHPPTLAEVQGRRATVRVALLTGLGGGATATFSPDPGAAKVVGAIVLALGVVVGLAAQIEPRRARRKADGGET
jgi:Ca2+/Na+ antiporter